MTQRKKSADKIPATHRRTRKSANSEPRALGPSLADFVRVLEQFRGSLSASGYGEALSSYQQLPDAIRAAKHDAPLEPKQAEDLARIQIAAARIAELLAGYCQAMVAIADAARGVAPISPAPMPETISAPVAPTPGIALGDRVTSILSGAARGLSVGILADQLGMERRALLAQIAPLESAGVVVISRAGGREIISLPQNGRRR